MTVAKHAVRLLLAAILLVAGVAHFSKTQEFLGQVPDFFPARTAVVQVSGVMEVGLGLALLLATGRGRVLAGVVVAAFFVAVFPGNLWQLVNGSDSFGLDSTTARALRLPFQPLLIAAALWSTGAWTAWASWRAHRAGNGPRS
ncbi:membrane protein [Nocardioides salsibiostraticola]